MINEVFVLEIDKNCQILALDFGWLKIIFLCVQNLFGWFIYVCPSQQLWLWRAFNQFISSVAEAAVGKERPQKVFHDQSLRKNAAGHGHRPRDRPHTKWTHAHPNELRRALSKGACCKSFFAQSAYLESNKTTYKTLLSNRNSHSCEKVLLLLGNHRID